MLQPYAMCERAGIAYPPRGLLAPVRPVVSLSFRLGRRSGLKPCCAANTSNSFQHSAERLAQQAQQKINDFVSKQDLQRKATKAAEELKKSANETYDRVELKARRTYSKLESKYQLNQKAQKAARRFEETVREVDQQYSIRRTFRNVGEQLKRKWPIWRRGFEEFSSTNLGKIVLGMLFVWLLTTSFFLKLVSAVLFLSWLSVPVSLVLVNLASQKQAQKLQEEQEKQRQRQRNPFGDIFNSAQARYKESKQTKRSTQQDGPVIDAEWHSLDE